MYDKSLIRPQYRRSHKRVRIPERLHRHLAQSESDFSTLVSAVVAADLTESLSAKGPLTVFAPTNADFDALPDGVLDQLLSDKEAITEVLTYHVVASRALSPDLSDGQKVNTLKRRIRRDQHFRKCENQ